MWRYQKLSRLVMRLIASLIYAGMINVSHGISCLQFLGICSLIIYKMVRMRLGFQDMEYLFSTSNE